MIARYAPWFWKAGPGTETEPRSYRAWKYAWQKRPSMSDPDLFDRIDDSEWDLLIILDACRFDTLRRISDSCVVRKAVSPASSTPGFLTLARGSNVFAGATYVSANPQVTDHPPTDESNVVDVSETAWSDSLGTVPPKPVYERSKESVRQGQRVVAHTLQPHYPHICEIDGDTCPVPNGLHPKQHEALTPDTKFQATLASGNIDLDVAKQSYRASLRYAWRQASDVAKTLARDGYTVVITADHGELFGEWGFVEHPVGVRIRELVTVPWVRFDPDIYPEDRDGDASVERRLEALGYRG